MYACWVLTGLDFSSAAATVLLQFETKYVNTHADHGYSRQWSVAVLYVVHGTISYHSNSWASGLSFELQHFYETEVQCTKWYMHYVYKLYDLHVMAENHTEAGFTLKLHADLLLWSDELLPEHSDCRYPGQFEWQRKEAIYHKIIAEFNRGKVFILVF